MKGPRYSIMPAGAIFDRSLEPRDLHVLALLGCHTDKLGWCRRSQVKMAAQLDCGRASVQRSLERLVESGWVQKRRPAWSNSEGPPSNSYEYKVILDRDDVPEVTLDDDEIDDSESHAADALQADQCPPVGRGAQPCAGTGAQPYVGTKNVPLERSDAAGDARATLIEKPAMELAEQMLVIAGHDLKFWPPGWCGAPMRVQTWLNSGWQPEIILAATRGVMARKTGPPPATVQFFEKAIADEIARQARPIPEASNVQATGDNRAPPRKGNAYARIAARLAQSSGGDVDSG